MALGVAVGDTTLATVMIARNTSVPTRKTETFKTNVGQQSTVRIHVCDGDHYLLRKNRVLCSIDLTVIPALPHQEVTVEISFDVNANGWLEIVAVEKSTGERKHVTVDAGRLPPTEVERMRQDVHVGALHSRSKLVLKAFADSVRSSAAKRIAGLKRKMEIARADEKKAIKALRWLHANPIAEKEEFDAKRQKLEEEASTTVVVAPSATNNETREE